MRQRLGLCATLLLAGCAAHGQLTGVVVDRNGAPVPRAMVGVAPGDVSVVTDQAGRYVVDYLREGDDARRVRLRTRQDYTLEFFKSGYHVQTVDLFYARGAVELPPVQMIEETLEVREDDLHIDLGLYTNPTHASGANYEGQ